MKHPSLRSAGGVAALVVLLATTDVMVSAAAATAKGATDVTSLVSGYEGYCALLRSGSVKCWGDDSYGQLGDGVLGVSSPTPVLAKGATDVTSLVSGYEGYCALLRSGSVKCWGDDSYGQLGDGVLGVSSPTPVLAKGA